MNGWTDDPELRRDLPRGGRGEARRRCATGCSSSRTHPAPKQLIAVAVPRRAHRQGLGARARASTASSALAHRAEDLLGALRDGRFARAPRPRRPAARRLPRASAARCPAPTRRSAPTTTWPRSSRRWTARSPARTRSRCRARGSRPPEVDDAPTLDGRGRVRGRRGDTVRVPDPTRARPARRRRRGRARARAGWSARSAGSPPSPPSTPTGPSALRQARRCTAASCADEVAERTCTRCSRSATSCRPRPATCAAGSRTPRPSSPRSATARWAWRWCPVRRVVAGFPQLVREVAAATGKDVALRARGRGRRARHPRARRRRRRAQAPGHQRRRPRLRDPGRARGRRQAPARATVRVSARRRRRDRRHRGGRRRRRHRRGRAARGRRRAAGCCPRTPPSTGQALLSAALRARLQHPRRRHRDLRPRRRARRRAHGGRGPRRHHRGRHRARASARRFTITLPVTLGVLRCLVARLGDERYALPVTDVVETLEPARTPPAHDRRRRAGPRPPRRRPMPLADLGRRLDVAGRARPARRRRRAATAAPASSSRWAVDALEGELELVVKDLGAFLGRLPGVGGATIDGDGSVMLLLDLRELARGQLGRAAGHRRARPRAAGHPCDGPQTGRSKTARRAGASPARRGCSSSRTRSASASCSG